MTPFKFTKLGIKYKFWRLAVSNTDAWRFCCVLPSANKVENIENIEILVPNCLQMGWFDSPERFCEASETDTLFQHVKVTEHPL